MFQFGGSLLKKGNAKTARPLSTKQAMHVVLRSSQATGEWSLRSLKNQKMVERTLRNLARRYGIKIYEFANVGNHLHLLIKLRKRYTFTPFIRALSGIIALKVTGTSKLEKLENKFWDYRPWTRIVEWKKAYTVARDYVIQNHLEAIGFILHKPRDYDRYFHKKAPT
jgi:REP element-mobilizing transposase RayT